MRSKQKTITLIIKLGPVALGHLPHTTGSGAHDLRPRRKRTRQAQKDAWKKIKD